MSENDRIKALRIVLVLVGLVFIFGIWPLGIVWPSGWAWHTEGRSEYYEMILGIYATLGVFLIIASRDPMRHLSLIWFAVWSSVVHGAIMGVQSLSNPHHMGHLWGDVAALIIVAVVVGATGLTRDVGVLLCFGRLWKLVEQHVYELKHQALGDDFLAEDVASEGCLAQLQFHRQLRYSADLERRAGQDPAGAVDRLHGHHPPLTPSRS